MGQETNSDMLGPGANRASGSRDCDMHTLVGIEIGINSNAFLGQRGTLDKTE